jgi:WD40 repeat protein
MLPRRLMLAAGCLAAISIIGISWWFHLFVRDGDEPQAAALPCGATARLGHLMHVGVLAFSPDGSRLAVRLTSEWGRYGPIQLWDVATGKVVAVLEGNRDGVISGAFSPDGMVFASTGTDRSLYYWDLKTGKLMGQESLTGPNSHRVTSLLGGDGLVSASDNAVLWTMPPKPDTAWIIPHRPTFMVYIAASPDGKLLITIGNRDAELWDTGARRRIAALYDDKDHTENHSFAFSPDSDVIVDYDGMTGEIRRWSAASRKPLPGEAVKLPICSRGSRFSPDVRFIAWYHEHANQFAIHDVGTGKLVSNIQGVEHGSPSFSFSPDSKTMAVGASDGSVRLWNVADGKLVRTFLERCLPVRAVRYADDGQTVLTLHEDNGFALQRWDVRARTRLDHCPLAVPIEDRSFRLSPGGHFLATVDRKGHLAVWSMDANKLLWETDRSLTIREPEMLRRDGRDGVRWRADEDEPITPKALLEFSTDGNAIAGLASDGRGVIWEAETGRQLHDIAVPANVRCLALGPGGKRFLLMLGLRGRLGKVSVVDPASGAQVTHLDVPARTSGDLGEPGNIDVHSLVVSPDGTQVAVVERVQNFGFESVYYQREIRLWQLGDQPKCRLIPAATTTAPVFSLEGNLLAFGLAYGLGVWDVQRGKLAKREAGDNVRIQDMDVDSLVFAPDAKTLATSGKHRTILLWEIAELFRNPAHEAK